MRIVFATAGRSRVSWPPGETNDLVAQNSEAGITRAVLLEGRAGAVRLPAVDLDDEALFGPREIDDEAADPNIHFRLREGGGGDRAQGDVASELRSRAIRVERVVEREA